VATSNFSDIELNQLIPKAINGDKDALAQLRSSKWLTRLLRKISLRMGDEFKVIPREIEDALSDAVCDKIETIKKPNKASMTAWCWTTARNFCLNKIRRGELDKEHREETIQARTIAGTRKTASNISQPLPITASNSPEKILLEKEAAVLLEKLRTDLYLKVKQELENLSPEDAKLLISWSGKTLEQLKEETGIPISTLSNQLKGLQKEILKKIGIWRFVKKDPQLWKGVAELIRNSLKAMNSAA
jgi:DNA-directed RNA polymerase specialized sigma24 family protein